MDNTFADVEITADDIRAAQQGAKWAQELVLGALRSRIAQQAFAAAPRAGEFWNIVDELKHVGMIAAWEALERFAGSTVDDFFGFMYRTTQTAIAEHLNALRFAGADRKATEAFCYWLRECDGDADLAEKLCQRTAAPGHTRLGRDRANAARLAVQGATALDAPYHTDDAGGEYTYADLLVSELGIPDESLTSDDLSQRERAVRIELVRAVLDSMGETRGTVLKATFGIEPFGEYGVHADDAIGAITGQTAKQVREARSKGFAAFAKKFIPLAAKDDADAETWWAAFHAKRAEGNASTVARARVAAAA